MEYRTLPHGWKQITNLRHTLHACPEISGQEKQTKETLQEFLKAHTSLELNDCGKGFYAAHREGTGNGIAFRADYDALALPEGGAAHLCGHDGHASALCGLALMLEGKTAGRDVFLLFQPAEEIGAGAYPCTELFEKEQITEIYGAHNLPGFAFGQVYTRTGTFACGFRRYDVKIPWKGNSCGLSGKWSVPGSCSGRAVKTGAGVPDTGTLYRHGALYGHWCADGRKGFWSSGSGCGNLADSPGRT